MKNLLLICALAIATPAAFAVSTTDMSTKWACTTNASSSEVAADKTADEQMANGVGSAADMFAMAAKNCRDCTKITCEVKE